MRQDKSKNDANQQEARVSSIAGSNKKIIYTNYIMDNNKLSSLAVNMPKNEINIVEEAKRPIPEPRKWYRDENGVKHPIAAPRRKHLLGGKMPIPAPRTKIGEKRKALNGYTKSYEIGIKSNFNALEQLQNTRLAISIYFGDIFNQLGGFKFVETLVVTFV